MADSMMHTPTKKRQRTRTTHAPMVVETEHEEVQVRGEDDESHSLAQLLPRDPAVNVETIKKLGQMPDTEGTMGYPMYSTLTGG